MTKTVLITGATGIVGSSIARHLASIGWSLVISSRNIEDCKILANELRAQTKYVHSIQLDLSNSEQTECFAERVHEMGIEVTHIVSNARSLDALALEADGTANLRNFTDEFVIDVVSPYRLIMAFKNSRHHCLEAIVTIGSQYGLVAPNPVLYEDGLSQSPIQYGVAKAALNQLTKELAVRLAPSTRVNSVAFGGFRGRATPEFISRYEKLTPSQKMLDPNDASGPVAFLLDEKLSAAVNGHTLVADGGWSIW